MATRALYVKFAAQVRAQFAQVDNQAISARERSFGKMVVESMAEKMAFGFQQDNPNFDLQRWREACGYKV